MKFRRCPQVVILVLGLFASGCTFITRVSVDTGGGDPNARSLAPSISRDGRYVAFDSAASDLVADDGNGLQDVFVRDLRAGTTTRVSVDTSGGDANGSSLSPSISDDGRYVAFESDANDLVPNDGNPFGNDIFVRDLQTAITTRASVDTSGGDPDRGSSQSAISGDGRYVAFSSSATDLVAGDHNGFVDVFVRDLRAGTTSRASVDATGGDPDDVSVSPAISDDGRHVAFLSDATDLVLGTNQVGREVYVRDLQAQTTVRATVDANGGDPNGASNDRPSLSGDGRYVAFSSDATDLVLADGNSATDVFVRDLQAGVTTRVSVDTAGGDPNDASVGGSISGDGRYVAFSSFATDLVSADGTGGLLGEDVFVRDVNAGTTARVSVDVLGQEANGPSRTESISHDGRYVAFNSTATDLAPGDGSGGDPGTDVFVRAVVSPTVDSVTPADVVRGSTTTVTLLGDGFFPGTRVSASAFSPGGVTVNSVTVVSEHELQVSLSVQADAPFGNRNVMVWNPGTGPGDLATGLGFCINCLNIPAPIEDFVVGNGSVFVETPVASFFVDFSIDAGSDAAGGNPSGTVSFQSPPIGNPHGPVTCLAVSGNTAVIGFGDTIDSSVVEVVDNGAIGLPDLIALARGTNCGVDPNLSPIPLVSGDIVVHDETP